MAKRKKRIRKIHGGGQTTDTEGLLWVQEVQVRPAHERRPMAKFSRWKKKMGVKTKTEEAVDMARAVEEEAFEDETDASATPVRGLVPTPGSMAALNENDDSDDEDENIQFTVTSIKTHPNFFQRFSLHCHLEDVDEFSYRPFKFFVIYINWTFRRGFMIVFVSFLAIFMLLNIAFGGFIKLAGSADPGCIVVSGEDFGYNPETKFADAFALSWTTFTTVGYGMIYTATGTDHGDQKQCALIVFLCTAESFIGLLYAGMCAAILFGKVGRIQSHAQVKFSNALLIQLGLPVPCAPEKDEPETPQAATPQRGKTLQMKSMVERNLRTARDTSVKYKVPFPVITFQVVNKLCNEPGGEIMDANMRVVASDRGAAGSASVVASFMKVQLVEYEHPFFNRVWHGRHTLDASSPLLSRFAKVIIAQNGGSWPEAWNNPKDVRKALSFSEIIVTLTGISNVSAATVHAYHRYKYGELLVGYEFAPVLYKSSDTQQLKVDMSLIHDVVGQRDGRAETVGDGDEEGRGSFTSIRLDETSH